MLEAVWFKDGKEVFVVSPVMNIVCWDDMEDVTRIEIEDGYHWYTYDDFEGEADDFVIRFKKKEMN
jgi:hypothetical protein